jgi:hypothetical protein
MYRDISSRVGRSISSLSSPEEAPCGIVAVEPQPRASTNSGNDMERWKLNGTQMESQTVEGATTLKTHERKGGSEDLTARKGKVTEAASSRKV